MDILIESLKKRIAHSIQNECAAFFFDSSCDRSINKYSKEILNVHLYPLTGSGKLIRSLILLLTAGSFGGEEAINKAFPAALAVECVHTYSLVHDDLPCMDNDSLRRGKPTTHVVYGDAKGLLVGDGLLTAAFEILSSPLEHGLSTSTSLKLIQILSKAISARGMIFGQWLDISQKTDEWEIFKTLHINKTGKLFAACFEMGLLCGLENLSHSFSEMKIQEIRNHIFQVGLDMGLSFQIIDDILDSTKSSEELGKTAGKDAEQNKLTAIKILGVDKATSYANECLNGALKNLENIFSENFPHEFEKHKDFFSSLISILKNVVK